MGKLAKKLMGKSEEQILKESIQKEVEKNRKQGMDVAECFALLSSCRDTFERTIRTERLNVLERRERRLGDAAQKSRIHDAAVGLIAVEEAEIELRGAVQASEMEKARKKMGAAVRQIGKLNPDTGLTKQDVKNRMNVTFDDSNETEAFVERADMVDEQFVEYLIQGYTMEECMEKKFTGEQATSAAGAIDFSGGNAQEDAAYIDEILRKNVDKR